MLEFHARQASPGLRPYLAGLVGYAYAGDPPELHRGLPSRHLTLVIALDEPLGIAWPGQPVSTYQVSASGLHDTAVRIGRSPNRSGVQVSLTPAGSRLLLGVPAAELSGLAVDLDDLLGAPARRLPDRLAELPAWEQRFAAVEEFLADAVRRRTRAELTGPAPEVTWAWRRLDTSHGTSGVQQLADEVGWSRRHLSERFRREYGLTPKTAARVLRFEQAVGRLRRSPTPRLADLAAACGFADQAHLTREWNALAGCPPRQWMAEELPFVQDQGPYGDQTRGHDWF